MITSAFNFLSEQDAAKAVLLEVTRLLNKRKIGYAVVGGWIPYLFNAIPISHPGTFDVDIVLDTSLGQAEVVSALDEMVIDTGYMRAPKNAFQVYRAVLVLGEVMIFHVDFLHRKYADDTADLTRSWGRYQSIAAPGTDVIFTDEQSRVESVSLLEMDGTAKTGPISFASEAAFLSSKGRSVGLGKRERDAFDIYLVIKQSMDLGTLKKVANGLMSNGVFCASMIRMFEQFDPNGGAVRNAVKYLCGTSPTYRKREEDAAIEIANCVRAFIREIAPEDQDEVFDRMEGLD